MPKFAVDLTNPDDQAAVAGLSYTSGRYGFTVTADTMDAAIDHAVARARQEGIYGYDWSAKVSQVAAKGPMDWRACKVIALRDDLEHPAFEWSRSEGCGQRIAGGGILLFA